MSTQLVRLSGCLAVEVLFCSSLSIVIKLFALGQMLKVVNGGKIFSNVHSKQDFPRPGDHS